MKADTVSAKRNNPQSDFWEHFGNTFPQKVQNDKIYQRTKRAKNLVKSTLYDNDKKCQKMPENGALAVGKDEVTGSIPVSSSNKKTP